jgi:hypothetical protein
MTRSARIALCLAACSAGFLAANAQVPPPREKAPARVKVEFRWLEDAPIKGVTEEKGIQTTCGPELSYPHREPVLTNKDIAGVAVKNHDFSRSGLPGDHFMATFTLTADARKKLAEASADGQTRWLATYVDGGYWGTSQVSKTTLGKLDLSAGYISSKELADRIADTFK